MEKIKLVALTLIIAVLIVGFFSGFAWLIVYKPEWILYVVLVTALLIISAKLAYDILK